MAADENINIFYSEVHPDVQQEIEFRAGTSLANTRSDEQLEWITSKTSWGSIILLQPDGKALRAALNSSGTPFHTDDINNKKNIKDSINNVVKTTINNIKNAANAYRPTDPDYLVSNFLNTRSGRTGPVLQQIAISLADTSFGAQGLLNEATVQILVPDIEFFIDEFDPTWFRIGLPAIIEIGHSVRTDSRANYGRFNGRLVNFNFEYQQDGTVNVVLFFKSTTELFTEISARKSVTETPTNELNTQTDDTSKTNISEDIITKLEKLFDKHLPVEKYKTSTTNNFNLTHVFNPTFEFDEGLVAKEEYTTSKIENSIIPYDTFISLIRTDVSTELTQEDIERLNALAGEERYSVLDATNSSAEVKQYVSLSTLVKVINATINSAWDNSNPRFERFIVSISPDKTTSLYYENLVSAYHDKIILPGSDAYPTDTYFNEPPITVTVGPITETIPGANIQFGRLTEFTSDSSNDRSTPLSFYRDVNEQTIGIPAHILISVDTIRELFEYANSVETKESKNDLKTEYYTVSHLLTEISNEISKATGNAIDLRLVPQPNSYVPDTDIDTPTKMIFRDITANAPKDSDTKVLSLPIFSSAPNNDTGNIKSEYRDAQNAFREITGGITGRYQRVGTVVRSFKITGKLPDSMKTLSLVLSQTSGIPKDQLGPYLKYIESDDDTEKQQIAAEYEKKFKNVNEQLDSAKTKYALDPSNETYQDELRVALKEYVVYPKPDLNQLFNFTTPIYPLTVELEMDGIYGFRFGDVISITGLPARYNNFVFSIIQVEHTLTTNHDWTTKISCFMRPKITTTAY